MNFSPKRYIDFAKTFTTQLMPTGLELVAAIKTSCTVR